MLNFLADSAPETLAGLTALVRIDANVPLDSTKTTIIDDFRLRASLPTLQHIIRHGGRVVLITHLGRPNQQNKASYTSTSVLIPWFKDHALEAVHAATPEAAAQELKNSLIPIIVLENIRFFKEETEPTETFAQQLAALGNYFVQDAFATLHRNHTSLTLLPLCFAPEKRFLGYLVRKELEHLAPLITTQQRFVALIGGAKIETKLPLLQKLLPRISTLMIAPPLCFTFMKALDKSVGKSLYNAEFLTQAQEFLQEAPGHYARVLLPEDFLVTDSSFDHPETCYSAVDLKDFEIGLSIGPRTTDYWAQLIAEADTFFANGLPGNKSYPETLKPLKILLKALAQNKSCTSMLAGGDTLAITKELGIMTHSYLSTGGGATLAYLADQNIPGLLPFVR